jgi:hypothetical protein
MLVSRIYSSTCGLLSALILAIFPLHIALSAGSLTETSKVFEIILGMLFLVLWAKPDGGRKLFLGAALLCLCWAGMTRYETWILYPLFPLYVYLRSRKLVLAVMFAFGLCLFPSAWLAWSYIQTGGFPGYSEAAVPLRGAGPVGLLHAAKIIANVVVAHLGWFLPLLILVGSAIPWLRWQKSNALERVLHYSAVVLFWVFLLTFAMIRGASIQDRTAILGMVLILPFFPLLLLNLGGRGQRWIWSGALVGVLSVGAAPYVRYHHHRPNFYLTRNRPVAVIQLVEWLQASRYRNSDVLLAKMQWQATYFPIYFPMTFEQHLVVWELVTDTAIEDFIVRNHPALFIRLDDTKDDPHQRRVELALQSKIPSDALVFDKSGVKVYDIEPLTLGRPSADQHGQLNRPGERGKGYAKHKS